MGMILSVLQDLLVDWGGLQQLMRPLSPRICCFLCSGCVYDELLRIVPQIDL